ncbi:hypothetical protein CB0940_05085 [Cercospora beticola]|uniref:SnoaL-like domain-containing protein n=1 Tax=Cercospora beticola TaxID=122368 RepID=A0A2G5HJG6_CERBT|nr:hypothetical protein CB0940_05085 [Cercospora beticola]PIA92665.1 hypothetical protein CB0940_05085 [Cercospora beticola]WPB02386.1 hypothetical protein RHO25_007020 [Cercospora beticola]
MAFHGPLETMTLSSKPKANDNVPGEPTASRLNRLSCAFPTIINTKDFSLQGPDVQELASCITPDWTGSMDTQPQGVTWSEQVKLWKARAAGMPNVRFEITHSNVDLDEVNGVATVWMEMEVMGMGDVVLGAVNEVNWRRVKDDKWECFRTKGMRGSPRPALSV